MNREDVIAYCRAKPWSSSDFPFDETTLVIRVQGRIFAFVGVETEPGSVSLKCDPGLAGDLRALWPAITPGWHLNKAHWNSVKLDGSLPPDLICKLIDQSYELVWAKLPPSVRKNPGLVPRVP